MIFKSLHPPHLPTERNAKPRTGRVGKLPREVSALAQRRQLRRWARVAVAVGDFVAIVSAYLIAGFIRFGDPLAGESFDILAVVIPVFFVAAANQRAYSVDSLASLRHASNNVIAAFLVTLCVVGLAVFFLKVSSDFSRAVFGTGAVIAIMALPLVRHALTRWVQRGLHGTIVNEVIIEDGVCVPRGRASLVLEAEKYALEPRLDDPTMLDRLGRFLECADRVIVACPPERRHHWAAALKGADVNAEVLAPELDAVGALGMARFGTSTTLVVASGPLGLMDRMLKRGLDLTLAVLSLPLALPLMVIIGIAIKLDSRGPVLFVQPRVGLGNRMFRMYKFRSMRIASADGAGDRSTARDDDRVTRVGRIIRATSLDELPQLLNVLQGAMSVVGPRPHALGSRAENRLFWDIDLTYWHRHAIKPGMTGLAQVRGYRGATEKTADLQNRLQADLEYLVGWSLWRDLAIIFATFRIMMHRNAY